MARPLSGRSRRQLAHFDARRASKSEVSRICAGLDEHVGAFRDRSLASTRFPYVLLDATYLKAHEGPHVVSKAVVIATGVRSDGGREVLGLAVGDSEDGALFGPRSCAACVPAAWAACSWSSPTPTTASNKRSPR